MSYAIVTVLSTGKARIVAGIIFLALLHLTAAGVLLTTEDDLTSKAAFVLTWIVLNSLWLIVLRRPAAAAGISLIMGVLLIALSLFKHRALTMTISVFDLMVVDADTISFVLTTFPDLQWQLTRFALVAVPMLILIWWIDPIRVQVRAAAAGLILSLVALTGLSFAVPLDREDEFQDHNYVSKFTRSATVAAVALATHPILEADAEAIGRKSRASSGPSDAGRRPRTIRRWAW